MQKTTKTDENGVTTQTNYMLDDVIETIDKHYNEKDELIKKLSIQKIEYGRTCITQFLLHSGKNINENYNYWENFDNELKKRILEIGGEPINIKINL